MKDLFKILLVLVVVTLPLAACFKSPEEKAAEEAAKQLETMFNGLGDFAANMENMDEEDMAASMGSLMQFGAEMEMQEFEKQESLSLPAKFPKNFAYNNAKVTGVNNSSSGDNIYLDLDFRTKDSVDNVKNFYKNLLNDGTWTVSNESIESGYYSISGQIESDNGYEGVDVTIYYNDYSTLVDISIYYNSYKY